MSSAGRKFEIGDVNLKSATKDSKGIDNVAFDEKEDDEEENDNENENENENEWKLCLF